MYFISMTFRLFLVLLTSCYISDSDVVGKGLEEFVVPGWYCFCLFFAIEMYMLWYCLLLEIVSEYDQEISQTADNPVAP